MNADSGKSICKKFQRVDKYEDYMMYGLWGTVSLALCSFFEYLIWPNPQTDLMGKVLMGVGIVPAFSVFAGLVFGMLGGTAILETCVYRMLSPYRKWMSKEQLREFRTFLELQVSLQDHLGEAKIEETMSQYLQLQSKKNKHDNFVKKWERLALGQEMPKEIVMHKKLAKKACRDAHQCIQDLTEQKTLLAEAQQEKQEQLQLKTTQKAVDQLRAEALASLELEAE